VVSELDAAAINTWDRQPFVTTVATGSPSIIPAITEIHHNFLFADYSGVKAIDHDDGSSYYFDHDNVIVGGWLHKNFLASPGHKRTSKTLGLFSPIGMHNSGPGEQNLETENYESLTNSTILMPEGGTYLMVPACDRNLLRMYIRTGANTIFTQNVSNVTIECGGTKDPDPQQKTLTLDDWQLRGQDKGTTLTDSMPSDSEIGNMIKEWLPFVG